MIAAGTMLTWQGQIAKGWNPLTTDEDIASTISSILGSENIIVEQSSVQQPDYLTQVTELGYAPFNLNLTLQATGGFNSSVDIQSLVDNAVYQATGNMPISSSITAINGTSTGQPSASSTPSVFTPVGTTISNVLGNTLGTVLTNTWGRTAIIIVALLLVGGLLLERKI